MKTPTYTPARDFTPEPGQAAPLGQGLYWLRMPLPFELNHINLWLMESASGWTLVDTGFNFAETAAALGRAVQGLLAAKRPSRIYSSRIFHPDHFGLAAMLEQRTGLKVRMTEPEFEIAHTLTGPADMDVLEREYRTYYTEAGLPDDLRLDMIARRFGYRKMVPTLPQDYIPVKPGRRCEAGRRRLEDRGRLRALPRTCLPVQRRAESFYFRRYRAALHQPEHQPVPRRQGDPVGSYLRSLDDIEMQVPDDVMVLPSHGVPFFGLHKRLGELRAHHARRFTRLHEFLRKAPTPLSRP